MATIQDTLNDQIAQIMQYLARRGIYVASTTFLSKEGAAAFLRYDKELKREEAEALSNQFKRKYMDVFEVETELVMAVHKVLRQNQSAAEKLPPRLLPIFLIWYSAFALIMGCDIESLHEFLPDAMRAVELFAAELEAQAMQRDA